MNLSNLKPAEGATSSSKRIGRGTGSGKGGTSTKGHKGQKSRSGYSKKVGFEGGQMPLQRRVPKFGFKPLKRVEYKAVNLETLQELADSQKLTKIDTEVLKNAGLIQGEIEAPKVRYCINKENWKIARNLFGNFFASEIKNNC